jgi:hypothetical protein
MKLSALDCFSIALHGDRREQLWWPLLSDSFSNYELFWRRYIVPLTFRIDTSISPRSSTWIRFRPEISRDVEQLGMRHYSVFYWTARAIYRVMKETAWMEFPEDVLSLLDSANDNVELFSKSLVGIARRTGTALPMLRGQFPRTYASVFETVRKYRDTIVHNPVLGRTSESPRELLPKQSRLGDVKDSWRAAELLGPKEFIATSDLILRIANEYVAALQDLWREVLDALACSSFDEKYIRVMNLSRFEPISAPTITSKCATVAQSIAASGTYTTPSPKPDAAE